MTNEPSSSPYANARRRRHAWTTFIRLTLAALALAMLLTSALFLYPWWRYPDATPVELTVREQATVQYRTSPRSTSRGGFTLRVPCAFEVGSVPYETSQYGPPNALIFLSRSEAQRACKGLKPGTRVRGWFLAEQSSCVVAATPTSATLFPLCIFLIPAWILLRIALHPNLGRANSRRPLRLHLGVESLLLPLPASLAALDAFSSVAVGVTPVVIALVATVVGSAIATRR